MGFTSWMVVDDSRIADRVEVIAHRAGYVRAPENSLSALRQAIAAKADWVEIDVQLTADGALVIVHDFDLLRVGGSPLRIASATLADIQQVDIGSPVGPEFAGERIPTLEEFLTAAHGQVGVLIELKFPPGSQVGPLTDAVLDTVRRLNAVPWCRVCSQSYAGIQRVRSQEPSIPIGFIAGAALGDLTQLQVDFLMVEARMATPELCDRARRRKMGIFAWTIKDAGQIAPLVDRGITGLIADDPEMVQVKLQELAQLDPVERILYRVRNVLAGQL
jgi:glycerophosphoryl diester phosphodiesterase